jgi:DNA repair protein RecN (Recombination protein N)
LQIRGLGVIDEAVIPLAPGLTVVTGETGAGKTMVLTGLALLAGAKADAAMVRRGNEAASVDGEWLLDADVSAGVLDRLADAGAEVEVDQGQAQVLMARVVASEGRSRAFAGGRTVPATVLQEVASELVAVHGQADQVRLRHPERQRKLLDRFGGEFVTQARDDYRETFNHWRASAAELADLIAHRSARDREAALLTVGIQEIEALSPEPGEDIELDRQAARLSHAGTLLSDVIEAHDALVGGESDGGSNRGPEAMASVARAIRAVERAIAVDPALGAVRDRLRDIASLLSDAAADLSGYAAEIDADPRRQAWVEERRSALTGLRRRYGSTIDDVLAWLEQARESVQGISGDDERVESLQHEVGQLRQALVERARNLSERRAEAGRRLSGLVTREMHELAMPEATIDVRVSSVFDPEQFGPSGADEVEFLLEPHAGAGFRPVGKGASGGELSRVMLAIEVVLAGADPVPTFIFDEVDAGIGGRAAVEVGRRLARLARTAQVLVVTHLPQVAAFADSHVVVTKTADGLVTASSVRVVEGDSRVGELVRMLSGLDGSSAGAAHAQELLAVAAQERPIVLTSTAELSWGTGGPPRQGP